MVASRYALPGYGDRRVWVRGQGCRIIVSGYSGVCFEIKFSGRHRGFDSILGSETLSISRCLNHLLQISSYCMRWPVSNGSVHTHY